MNSREHLVRFYETETSLLQALREYIGDALRARETAIVIATAGHRDELNALLEVDGVDVPAAVANGRYVALDAAATLSRFMVDGVPDAARFEAAVGSVIGRAAQAGAPVRAFGEMVALLAGEGNFSGATQLEALWNGLQQAHDFTLLCGYQIDLLAAGAAAGVIDEVSALHTSVTPSEAFTALTTDDERMRMVAQLEQKARALEFEVTARKRAEERLRFALDSERAAHEGADAARVSAEAAFRLRDEFLGIAAHELRTPLTTLLGNVQLLLRRFDRDRAVPADVAGHMLKQVSDQTLKLSRLLSQLLDVSRFEAGKLSLERQPTDLAAVVRGFALEAEARDPSHRINVDAPAGLVVDADPLRLEQVLTNLVSNATKYSPERAAIDIRLRVLDTGPRGSVEMVVRDWGVGIPVERRPYIFDRFYQAHDGDHQGGLGLGLYICRQIVELHKGTIVAEFPGDGGTRMVVRLPAYVPSTRERGDESEARSEARVGRDAAS